MMPKDATAASGLELALADLSFETDRLLQASRACADAFSQFGEVASLALLDDWQLAERKSACDEALVELELIARFGTHDRRRPLGHPYLRPRASRKGRRSAP